MWFSRCLQKIPIKYRKRIFQIKGHFRTLHICCLTCVEGNPFSTKIWLVGSHTDTLLRFELFTPGQRSPFVIVRLITSMGQIKPLSTVQGHHTYKICSSRNPQKSRSILAKAPRGIISNWLALRNLEDNNNKWLIKKSRVPSPYSLNLKGGWVGACCAHYGPLEYIWRRIMHPALSLFSYVISSSQSWRYRWRRRGAFHNVHHFAQCLIWFGLTL